MSAAMVYITAENKQEAEKLGKLLVENRWAACANIIDGMNSVYWWDGNLEQGRETILIVKTRHSLVDGLTQVVLEQGRETILIVKTRQSLVDGLTQVVLEHHGYDCPCVVAMPIFGGNPDYLAWIKRETREAG